MAKKTPSTRKKKKKAAKPRKAARPAKREKFPLSPILTAVKAGIGKLKGDLARQKGDPETSQRIQGAITTLEQVSTMTSEICPDQK